jgi:nucleoid-associated protein YgaU
MPQPPNLKKAEIHEIDLNKKEAASREIIKVQFNPETLKVIFSKRIIGEGSSIQYAGKGTTKLSMELWFDVTVSHYNGNIQKEDDVRKLTQKIAYFMKPKKEKLVPPGIRFIWGTFKFDGVMDSLNEDLEFFSDDGKPLRARVSISISSLEHQFVFNAPESGPQVSPGTQPLLQVKTGDTAQKVAESIGKGNYWKVLAAANGIENPRRLTPGTLLDVNIRRK